MFEKNQCVIFTSLEDQFNLRIVYASLNFKRIFKF